MNSQPVETFEHKGLTVEIHLDDDPESPREWDNLGTMVCFHNRYRLGDKHSLRSEDYSGWAEIKKTLEDDGAVVVLPLYLLDHSGLAMRTGPFGEDPGGWDSGVVGFIYVTRDQIIKEYGNDSPETIAKATEVLEGEVDTYDQYLQGMVYGFVVKDAYGNYLDSCWGFYEKNGLPDYVKEEARAAAERCAKELESNVIDYEVSSSEAIGALRDSLNAILTNAKSSLEPSQRAAGTKAVKLADKWLELNKKGE